MAFMLRTNTCTILIIYKNKWETRAVLAIKTLVMVFRSC